MRSQGLNEQCRWQTEICLASFVKTLAFGFLLSVICISSMPAQERVRLVPQLGSDITAVAFSPDGRFVLTGAGRADFTARLWDFATGLQVLSLKGHKEPVRAVAFSRDGRFVVTGSADRTARLWDPVTGKQLRSLEHPSDLWSVAVSPDSRFVLTGSGDNTARLWDVATGRQLRSFKHTGPWHGNVVSAVAFSPDGRFLLTGSWDSTARLWDAATGQQLRSFKVPPAWVTSAAFSPDGHFVVTGSDDGIARLWDAATGKNVHSFDAHIGASPNIPVHVAYSPDGHFLLTGSDDLTGSGNQTLRLWDPVTGQKLRSFEGYAAGTDHAVVFSPDSRYILASSWGDETARLWDRVTGQELRSFKGHTSAAGPLAISSDGRYLLVGANEDKVAHLWDLSTGQQLRTFVGHTGYISAVAISPDGRFVLTGSAGFGDSTARLWDRATGKQLHSFAGLTGRPDTRQIDLSEDYLRTVGFSPDGRFVLTCSWNHARLWDRATGEQLRSFDDGTQSSAVVNAASFSPDGRFVLTGGFHDKTELWDAATGRLVRSFAGHRSEINAVAFSPDGSLVLTGDADGTASLWNVATGQQVRSLDVSAKSVDAVAFSPDGRLVWTASRDGSVGMWDASTGQQLRRLVEHMDGVFSIALSLDGRLLLTGSLDGTARIWQAATGRELAALIGFDAGGWAVTDPEGRYDASDPDSSPGLIWVSDKLRFIELRQLKKRYYTPNLLARTLQGERLPEVTGLDQVPAPPIVSIASGLQSGKRTLRLTIQNDGDGVGQVLIKVNHRLVRALEHPVAPRPGRQETMAVDLSDAPLITGTNNITATAYDVGNQIESHPATLTWEIAATEKGFVRESPLQEQAAPPPHFFAVVTGTAAYANANLDLQFSAEDAESMAASLRLGATRLFGRENISVRLLSSTALNPSDQPTKKNISAAFADVRRQARTEDVLLVYFSGHGINAHAEHDSYYYLTADARSFDIEQDPALRNLSTVSSAELRTWLGAPGMPLKEVLILDTCAAGAANAEMIRLAERRDVPPDQRRAVELLKDATGSFILMGSTADAVSYEASRFGRGLLTWSLLQGMRGPALDEGSRLNVSHWFQYAAEEVPDLAQSIGGIQRPVISAPQGTGFPVAMLTTEDRASIPVAAVKPELLRVSCLDENDLDHLDLESAIRQRLRDLSHPQGRGEAAHEAPIVYLDQVTDDLPGALRPQIRYEVAGSTVIMHVRMILNGKRVSEETVTASAIDKGTLVNVAASNLLAMAGSMHEDTKNN